MDLDIKKVWTPKKNIPIRPLSIPKYFAALNPIEVLKNTTKGTPCFWDKFPIRLEKKYTSNDANKLHERTTNKFKS